MTSDGSFLTNAVVNGSSPSITTTSTYPYTYLSTCMESVHISDETRTILLETFKEDELDKILNTVKERNPDHFPTLLKDFVRNRHFSEDFLLSYAEYLTKGDIKVRHNEHLISGDYPTLALLLISR